MLLHSLPGVGLNVGGPINGFSVGLRVGELERVWKGYTAMITTPDAPLPPRALVACGPPPPPPDDRVC